MFVKCRFECAVYSQKKGRMVIYNRIIIFKWESVPIFLLYTYKPEVKMEELREIIEKQPTAYDVENVVEALEEQQEYYSFDLDNDLDCAKYKAYKNAIDIVKRGGVDNEYKG